MPDANPLRELRKVILDDGEHAVLCCRACDAVLGPEDERNGTCHVCDARSRARQSSTTGTASPSGPRTGS